MYSSSRLKKNTKISLIIWLLSIPTAVILKILTNNDNLMYLGNISQDMFITLKVAAELATLVAASGWIVPVSVFIYRKSFGL